MEMALMCWETPEYQNKNSFRNKFDKNRIQFDNKKIKQSNN